MKKAIFTSFHSLGRVKNMVTKLGLLPALMLCCSSLAIAQAPYCSLNCNANVNISVAANCRANVTYDVMLTGANNPTVCSPNGPQAFKVIIMGPDGITPLHPDNSNAYDYVDLNELYALGMSCPADLTVKVKHWATGNSCWGSIHVEDKLAPVAVCPPNRTYKCAQWGSAEVTSQMAADLDYVRSNSTDNCGVVDATVTSSVTFDDCPAEGSNITKIITKTYTVTDRCGKQGTCTQYYYFTRLESLSEVECPAPTTVSCNGGDTSPSVTGYPTWMNYEITPESHACCRVAATYHDVTVEVCCGSYKIFRHWDIADWCTGQAEELCIQLIKVEDSEGPSITCPADATISTTSWACSRNYTFPTPQVSDACCPDGITVTREVDGNVVTGSSAALTEGAHEICYTATDGCGNETTCCYTVTVVDESAPNVICKELLQVTLDPTDCNVVVPAQAFDNGSYDNCCDELTFRVRKMNGGSFDSSVTFDGSDLGVHEGTHGTATSCGSRMVVLEVTDCHGNSNTCMVEVLVDDKAAPYCPEITDATVNCASGNDPWQYFSHYTAADFHDCSTVTVTESNGGTLDECKRGVLSRTWTATDACGNSTSCTQRVTFYHVNDFSVCFPADVTVNGCEDAGYHCRPIITGDDCELIAIDSTDEILPIVGGEEACYKILRTWKVINWCVYNPNAPHTADMAMGNCSNCNNGSNTGKKFKDTGDGYVEWTQVIKVRDNVPPVVTPHNECDPNQQGVYPTDGRCYYHILTATATTNCEEILRFYYKIDLNNDGTYDIIDNVGTVGSGSASQVLPKGTHRIVWSVEDACGNVGTATEVFTATDCKKPTPYCIGISTAVMPSSGCIEVWASDLDAGSWDNCGDVTLGIRRQGDTGAPTPSITICCPLAGPNVIVELHVTDECGNSDFCLTSIYVTGCPGTPDPSVAGLVHTEELENVEQVTITASNNGNAIGGAATTAPSGVFQLALPMGSSYTITPEKNMNPLNGVSTFDLVLMRKHILGTELLDSPYKMIAADVNRSNSITTLDMVELRKLILGITTEFPNNTESWRFVRADYQFQNAANPFNENFPEVYNIDNLTGEMNNADFVGVKVGDLNGNATPNSLLGSNDRNNNGTFVLAAKDQSIVAGQEVKVNFTANTTDIAGYQFTLAFDKNALEVVNVEGLAPEFFGFTRTNEGFITTSFDNNDATKEVSFTVTFKALATGQLSKLISANSAVTKAEAYSKTAQGMDVAIQFNGATVNNTFEVYQNQPNPFMNSTVIGFNLPEGGAVTMRIMDVDGKIVKTVTGNYAKGYNQITVSKSELNASGVMYYE